MDLTNIGVIGCGHWGPNHVRVFSQLRESRVVACADLDPKRLEAIREQYPQVSVFHDYQELLKTAAVDAVVVVARSGVARKRTVRQALDQLPADRVAGVVLMDSHPS